MAKFAGIGVTAMVHRMVFAEERAMRGGFMICTGMSGSGVWILLPAPWGVVFSAGAASRVTRKDVVLRFGGGANQMMLIAMSDSV